MADFNWGMQSTGGFFYALPGAGNAAQGANIGAIGTDKFLKSISVNLFISGASPPRVAVYQGGVIDNPNGASLLYDFGQLTNTTGWQTIVIPEVSRPSIAQNVFTWIAWKDNVQDELWQSENIDANFENFLGTQGLREGIGIGSDETSAFAATISATGSTPADTQVIPAYLTYTEVPSTLDLQGMSFVAV